MASLRTLLAAVSLAVLCAAVARADADEDHWAWKRPIRPTVPINRGATAIDRFIVSRLEADSLTPTPPAGRQTLIRRLTFDLTGLPPTPEEVDAFVADAAPDAYERLVDRLLASPHYGERSGRLWLDLARYADSNGYEHDEVRPNAWRYRDYVIRSFNADTPYDRFIVEQLAGDQAFPGNTDALVATAFNLLGPDMTDSADQAQRRLNTLNDMTDTAALAFLGLTVACARCHDHKFEPIPQLDYYRLQAFFAGAEFRSDLVVASRAEQEAYNAAKRWYESLTKDTRDAIATLEAPIRTRLREAKLAKLSAEAQAAHRTPPEQRDGGQLELVEQTGRFITVSDADVDKALPAADRATLRDLRSKLKSFDRDRPPALPVAMGLRDRAGPPPKTYFLERGELTNRTREVDPGFLTTLVSVPAPAAGPDHRRLALARWIARPDNPLTARVIVNRLWQQHFGRGIVATTSDFGLRGERPTHPELLDWLATELVDGGWRLKRIHKLIVMSEAYRRSADSAPAALERDPENRLLARRNRIRLDAEQVRDALLLVSGRLNPKAGGPGVQTKVPAEAAKGAKGAAGSADPAEHARASVYLFARRNLRQPFLEAFDLPDSNLSCPKRERSTTAPQALALLNAPEAVEAAAALAGRVEREAADSSVRETTDLATTRRITRAYRLALGRPPSADELSRATAFLRQSSLAELCRALVNLNEFVYLD